MGFGKRLFVVDVGRRAIVTSHLRRRGGRVDLSAPRLLTERDLAGDERLPLDIRKGEDVLVSMRDEFFEFFKFELPPASHKELKPLVVHRCRQQATQDSLVGAKLAGTIKDARGLPKQRLVVARIQKEMVARVVKSLELHKNRFLGVVPRSELVLASLTGVEDEIPPNDKSFCVVGMIPTMLAIYFFQGADFLFARHVALQHDLPEEEKGQRIAMEFVQSNLYMNQRYRLECAKVFFAAGEHEKTRLFEVVEAGIGMEVTGLCSVAAGFFSRIPAASDLLLGSAAWFLNKRPHERLLVLPPEVKQFYRSRRVSTIALTSAGVLLVGSVLWGLGMSRDLHMLKKREMETRNRLLMDKGKVKVLEKEFPDMESWKSLRSMGEVNPGSPPLQQVLAVLSNASIPQVVLTSCGVERVKNGIRVRITGEAASASSHIDALKSGRTFLDLADEGFKKVWPGVSIEKREIAPALATSKGNRQGQETVAGPKVYRATLSAEYLLSGSDLR